LELVVFFLSVLVNALNDFMAEITWSFFFSSKEFLIFNSSFFNAVSSA